MIAQNNIVIMRLPTLKVGTLLKDRVFYTKYRVKKQLSTEHLHPKKIRSKAKTEQRQTKKTSP